MPFLADIVTVLAGDGVASFGVDLFTSTNASPPFLHSGSLSIVATSGTSSERTQNDRKGPPATIRPGAQVTARARDYTTAEVIARLAYNSLVRVQNQWINSGWYKEIVALQEPFDGGNDTRGQAQCQFNVVAKIGRRPW